MTLSARALELLEEALALPASERRTIAEALLDSLPSAATAVEPELRATVLERVEQVLSGEARLETWAEVRRRIRNARS